MRKKFGYKNAKTLRGGFYKWNYEKRPQEDAEGKETTQIQPHVWLASSVIESASMVSSPKRVRQKIEEEAAKKAQKTENKKEKKRNKLEKHEQKKQNKIKKNKK
eukprot:TRINITY_DN1597_c0_g1_i2.p1 TRINITY_DN1597_c0_g1~~TRINITY_DN1597_c0_g1_i2.p1  ORF type:complete len:104 (+),score=37.82 TRINITY_DN1597_c0_g1_i2:509-820(+)